MPDNDKIIANLDFTVNTSKLDEINDKLQKIAETSQTLTNTISSNLQNAIGTNIVDTKAVKTNLNEVVTLNKTNLQKIEVERQKSAIRVSEYEKKAAITTEEQQKRSSSRAANQIIANNNSVLQSSLTMYDKISSYAQTYLIYQGFNELKSVIPEVVDEMVEMENQMVSIDRVMNEDGLNLDNYRDKLLNLATEYGNSFNNVADITLRLAQAGFDSQESLALTEKTLLALNTAELDATEATDDMVAIMEQWGLTTGSAMEQADKYAEIIDKVNKLGDKYPTTSADLLDALKKTSSAFNLAGASIDETLATIVATEKASQRGGKEIGNALGNIIQQLKDSKRLSIAESLGLDFYTDETKTEFKDIMDIFEEMADKMQALKDAGKENSTEMQELLSIFTVFRRNIGASMLSEMSGETSTYATALQDSLTATGYSINENSKYMATATAAQEQFNNELLKLKTAIWDNGLEEMFRDMLSFGKDTVTNITKLINKYGELPAAVGVVSLAFTSFNKTTNSVVKNIISAASNIKQVNNLLGGQLPSNIEMTTKQQKKYNAILASSNKSLTNYIDNTTEGTLSLKQYAVQTAATTIKTTALAVATAALQAALSVGLSVAISALIGLISNYINAQENAIKKAKEMQQTHEDNASEIKTERDSLEELRKEYEEFTKKEKFSTEDIEKLYELQVKINDAIKESGVQVDLVNTTINDQKETVQEVNKAYDEQLAKIKAVEYEKQKEQVQELEEAADAANERSCWN